VRPLCGGGRVVFFGVPIKVLALGARGRGGSALFGSHMRREPMAKFRYVVTVEARTAALADVVMAERLNCDEEYFEGETGESFDYRISWEGLPSAVCTAWVDLSPYGGIGYRCSLPHRVR